MINIDGHDECHEYDQYDDEDDDEHDEYDDGLAWSILMMSMMMSV